MNMRRIFRSLGVTAIAYIALLAPSASPQQSPLRETSPSPSPAKLQIGIVVFDNLTLLDVVGPSSYLELLSRIQHPVNFVTVGKQIGRVQPDEMVPLYPTAAYAEAPAQFDVLVIPGGPGNSDVVADAEFLSYVKRAAEPSTFVLSVCTGANILASTGLIDGRNATTNKAKFKEISGKHPQVNWVRKARWVVDGKYWTSPGISAGLDMGHAFIENQYGRAAADQLARTLETVPIDDSSNDPFEYVIDLKGL